MRTSHRSRESHLRAQMNPEQSMRQQLQYLAKSTAARDYVRFIGNDGKDLP